jgi:hypothetical protein
MLLLLLLLIGVAMMMMEITKQNKATTNKRWSGREGKQNCRYIVGKFGENMGWERKND